MLLLMWRGKYFDCLESFCNPSGRWSEPLDLIFWVILSRSCVSNHVEPATFHVESQVFLMMRTE